MQMKMFKISRVIIFLVNGQNLNIVSMFPQMSASAPLVFYGIAGGVSEGRQVNLALF